MICPIGTVVPSVVSPQLFLGEKMPEEIRKELTPAMHRVLAVERVWDLDYFHDDGRFDGTKWYLTVLQAMTELRDELNAVFDDPLKTEDTTYEKLKVGDFYLNPKDVRKRKIQFDRYVASVAVDPAYHGYASCPSPSQPVKKIIIE